MTTMAEGVRDHCGPQSGSLKFCDSVYIGLVSMLDGTVEPQNMVYGNFKCSICDSLWREFLRYEVHYAGNATSGALTTVINSQERSPK